MSGWPAPVHGTRTRYRKGCRCDECRVANATYMREFRKRAQLRTGDWAHGLVSTYVNLGCRCDPCREAGLQYQREAAAARAGLRRADAEEWRQLLATTRPPAIWEAVVTLRGDRVLGMCIGLDLARDHVILQTRIGTITEYPFGLVRAA